MQLTRIEDPSVWYAPDIKGNHALDPAKRFAVLIKPMTRQEMVSVKSDPVSKLQTECKDGVEMLNRWDIVRDAVLRASVLEVKNLHVRTVKGGDESFEEITDAEGLIGTGSDMVLNAIYAAIEDHSIMADGLLGKSASPSASCATPIQASGTGDATGPADGQTEAKSQTSSSDEPGDAMRSTRTSTSISPLDYSAAPGAN